MSRINSDDPKWTAYVLGELSETERAAVELEIDSSEEARRLVDDLRDAAEIAKTEFRREITETSLTAVQRKNILSSVRPQRYWFSVRAAVWASGLAAAVFAFAALRLRVEPPLQRPVAPTASVLNEKDQSADRSAPAVVSNLGEDAHELKKQPSSPPARLAQAPKALTGAAASEVSALRTEPAGVPAAASATYNQRDLRDLDAKQELQNQNRDQFAQNQAQAISQAVISGPSSQGAGAVRAPVELNGARMNMSRTVKTARNAVGDNPFQVAAQNPSSTFSFEVGTSSYSEVQEYLEQSRLPPRDAVRIEELINHFAYDYPAPDSGHAIVASIESAAAPWNPQHRLVRIGVIARPAGAEAEVSFNPALVAAYRLIGFENGAPAADALKSAITDAERPSGVRSVTALYEVVPAGKTAAETLTLRIIYKESANGQIKEMRFPFVDQGQTFSAASADFRFAAAVAGFGMILRDSPYKGDATLDSILRIAEDSLGPDGNGARRAVVQMIQRAREIRRN